MWKNTNSPTTTQIDGIRETTKMCKTTKNTKNVGSVYLIVPPHLGGFSTQIGVPLLGGYVHGERGDLCRFRASRGQTWYPLPAKKPPPPPPPAGGRIWGFPGKMRKCAKTTNPRETNNPGPTPHDPPPPGKNQKDSPPNRKRPPPHLEMLTTANARSPNWPPIGKKRAAQVGGCPRICWRPLIGEGPSFNRICDPVEIGPPPTRKRSG